MPFVKLDTGILDSSLWLENAETRIVFITMLTMCDPNGLCSATAPGITRRANLPLDRVRAALAQLEGPDADSRTVDHEGRRIRRVDGGYLVLNYLKYRAKDFTAADRAKRYRRHKHDQAVLPSPPSLDSSQDEIRGEGESKRDATRDATAVTRDATQDAPSRSGPSFTKPTLEEVAAEIQAKGYTFTAERFHSVHERAAKAGVWCTARGQAITDWRAELAAWQASERPQPKGADAPPAGDRWCERCHMQACQPRSKLCRSCLEADEVRAKAATGSTP